MKICKKFEFPAFKNWDKYSHLLEKKNQLILPHWTTDQCDQMAKFYFNIWNLYKIESRPKTKVGSKICKTLKKPKPFED